MVSLWRFRNVGLDANRLTSRQDQIDMLQKELAASKGIGSSKNAAATKENEIDQTLRVLQDELLAKQLQIDAAEAKATRPRSIAQVQIGSTAKAEDNAILKDELATAQRRIEELRQDAIAKEQEVEHTLSILQEEIQSKKQDLDAMRHAASEKEFE